MQPVRRRFCCVPSIEVPVVRWLSPITCFCLIPISYSVGPSAMLLCRPRRCPRRHVLCVPRRRKARFQITDQRVCVRPPVAPAAVLPEIPPGLPVLPAPKADQATALQRPFWQLQCQLRLQLFFYQRLQRLLRQKSSKLGRMINFSAPPPPDVAARRSLR